MKIISGYRGGQFIKVPKTIKVRPTTGKSKEGIFTILNNSFDFENLKVLDLFSELEILVMNLNREVQTLLRLIIILILLNF